MDDDIKKSAVKENLSDAQPSEAKNDFGSILAAARKIQNHTIADVSEFIKIPGRIIIALEENDLTELPEPIFTQGYLRTYARFLELPEDDVLAAYNRAVPHDSSGELKSSSPLPNETNSQSLWVKLVTLVLLVAGIVVAIFAGYQYYQKKADIMASKLDSKASVFTGHSLDSAGADQLDIKQNANLDEKTERQLDGNVAPDLERAAGVSNGSIMAAQAEVKSPGRDAENTASNKKSKVRKKTSINQSALKVDVLEVIAEKDAWLDVRDASSTRLFYNILKQGRSKSLKGRAPFTVSLGNARVARVLINDIEVDMKRYIRSSNTAKFIVSSEQDEVIFH